MKKVKTSEIENILKHASKEDLSPLLKTFEESEFTIEINHLLQKKSISKSDLIKKTILDRTYAYQILQGTKIGSKDKIIQLSLALECTLEEVNRLLKLSDNAPLYAKKKRDAILILAFEKNLNVMETNELLNQLNFESL